MELVRQFSNEMNSVYEGKLPVSRAKMASVTKLALKASKYYKHVVMTVEKFVSKCAPEYKVPGLYVIDSIVRQSRHQFGEDKDNFGPRFSKSFEKTFLNLFLCPPDDKPKIIRVLNLWQKNGVFPPEVIQPLLALAPSPVLSPGHSQPSVEAAPPTSQSDQPQTAGDGGGSVTLDLDSANAIIQQQQSQIQALLQQQQQLQSQASTLLGPALQGLLSQASDSVSIATLVKQTQQLQQCQQLASQQQQMTTNGGDQPPAQMSNKVPHSSREPHTEFNTALLDDFDYSDDEDDVERRLDERLQAQETGNVDNGPVDATDHMLEELQVQFRLQESMRTDPPITQATPSNSLLPPIPPHMPPRLDPPMVPPLFPPPNMPVPPPMNFPHPPRPPLPSVDYNHGTHPPPPNPSHYHPPHHSPSPPHHRGHNRDRFCSPPNSHSKRGRRRSPSPPRRHSGAWRDRDWDRDRDRRSPRQRSPRQRSPWRRSRTPPHRDRKNSRSRTPPHRSPRRRSQRSSEESERSSKRGAQKDKHVTVMSTTIWMGHLAKSVSKEQITQACNEHGQVQSVDVVSARGCAYVVMETRSDAVKVLNALKDIKLNGSICKLAWAPGRGVKGATYRNFWNLENGFSIIPWNVIHTQTELDGLMDGGWIEPATCPPGMNLPEPPKAPPPATEPLLPLVPPNTLPPPGPLFPPQGMTHPSVGPPAPLGNPQPMFPPPISSGPPVPLMPPSDAQLPSKRRHSEENDVGTNIDMQLDSPQPLNSEL